MSGWTRRHTHELQGSELEVMPHLNALQHAQQPLPGDSLLYQLLLLLLLVMLLLLPPMQRCESKQHNSQVLGLEPWQLLQSSSHERMQQLLPCLLQLC